MPIPAVLAVHAVPHPKLHVRQAGFPIDHPYVEHCWSAVVGPSCTLLLRRMPQLWREDEPAIVEASEFSRSLGLGGNTGYRNSRFWRTIERFTQFGLGSLSQPDVLEVYVTVPPLTVRQLQKAPEWSRRTHDRLLGEHLDQLAAGGRRGEGLRQDHISARLDRLEHDPPAHSPGLGR